jgi:hypothetical protein
MRRLIATLAAAGAIVALSTGSALAKTDSSTLKTQSNAVNTQRSAVKGESSSPPCVYIENDTGKDYVGLLSDGYYDQVPEGIYDISFCPANEQTHGIDYWEYVDQTYGGCLTADAQYGYTYETGCGDYTDSQLWHYYGAGNTLENYYTSECLWFVGQPPTPHNAVNIGGCKLNENNSITEVPVS